MAFGVDQPGVHAMFGHGVPHGSQVHHGRDPTSGGGGGGKTNSRPEHR